MLYRYIALCYRVKCYYYLIDEVIKAQNGLITFQSHTANERLGWDSKSVGILKSVSSSSVQ